MKLFFNYRREETSDLAGRLQDRLSTDFGAENIFKDVDSIRPGQNWRVVLEQSISSSDVVLAIVGRQWLTLSDPSGNRRLDNDKDYVRFELEAARRNGKVVIPVVVQGATIPNPKLLPESIRWLTDFQQIELRPDPFFRDDVAKLVSELIRIRDRLKEVQQNAARTAPTAGRTAQDSGGLIRCSSCHAQCDRSHQFCQVCGAGLWAQCPVCDLPVPQNQVFCGGCGSNLPKLREVITLTETNEKRFARVAAVADPAERLAQLDVLHRELEAAIRVYPKHQPLERLQFQTVELQRGTACRLADQSFESGQLQVARALYQAYRQLDPLSEHAQTRLKEIDERYQRDLSGVRDLASRGDYRAAVTAMKSLCSSFPTDGALNTELQRLQDILDRLSKLIPEGLRELKRQRNVVGLEKELQWLKQQRIPVRNLDTWIIEVGTILRKANDDYQEALGELREGRFRQARKIAGSILKNVADHAGAVEVIAATSGKEEALAQLQMLLKRQRFCAANDLLKKLESQNVTDPRLSRLAAAVKVEVDGLDASIRQMLTLFAITSIPGYFVGSKLYDLLPQGESAPTGFTALLVWLMTVLGTPLVVVGVIFLATSHKAERISRFCFDWLPFGRLKSRRSLHSDSSETAADAGADETKSDITDERPMAAGSTTASDPEIHTKAAVPPETGVPKAVTAESVDRPFRAVEPDLVLFQSAELDRAAVLVELLTVGLLTFCLSMWCGDRIWQWLLHLRFSPDTESDARTLQILSPVSGLISVMVMSLLAVCLEAASRWKRLLTIGGIYVFGEFLSAILFPALIPFLRIGLGVGLIWMLIAELKHLSFWRTASLQLMGAIGSLLVLTAIAVPLFIIAAVMKYPQHSVAPDHQLPLFTTAMLMCLVYATLVTPDNIRFSRLAAEDSKIRGTLALGTAWMVAAILAMVVAVVTAIVKEEWHGAGKWILLLLFAQALPMVLTGSRASPWSKQWLTISAVVTLMMSVLWWLIPGAAAMMLPAAFGMSVVSVLLAETPNLLTIHDPLWTQMKTRQSRRWFRLQHLLKRR
jgi:hypothetical protein